MYMYMYVCALHTVYVYTYAPASKNATKRFWSKPRPPTRCINMRGMMI